jgi:acetyl esterase/lipase
MNPQHIPYGGDASQFFELWRPEQRPVGFAVFIHGGFWRAKYDLDHATPFCSALAGKGIAVANLEYRRVGQPGGGWPATFEDVVAGVKAASEQLGGAPIVIGHSAGGHLALRLAAEPVLLQAVIALAPVANLRLAHELNLSNGAVVEFLGDTPESVPTLYDEACPSQHPPAVRTIIVHGSNDEDVPIGISRSFVSKGNNENRAPSLIEVPGAHHMELIEPRTPAGTEVLDLVVRLARG